MFFPDPRPKTQNLFPKRSLLDERNPARLYVGLAQLETSAACLRIKGQNVHVALKDPADVGLKGIVVTVEEAPSQRPTVEAFYQRSLN